MKKKEDLSILEIYFSIQYININNRLITIFNRKKIY